MSHEITQPTTITTRSPAPIIHPLNDHSRYINKKTNDTDDTEDTDNIDNTIYPSFSSVMNPDLCASRLRYKPMNNQFEARTKSNTLVDPTPPRIWCTANEIRDLSCPRRARQNGVEPKDLTQVSRWTTVQPISWHLSSTLNYIILHHRTTHHHGRTTPLSLQTPLTGATATLYTSYQSRRAT